MSMGGDDHDAGIETREEALVDDAIDEASMDSFPASDPPSWAAVRTGRPKPALKREGDATPTRRRP